MRALLLSGLLVISVSAGAQTLPIDAGRFIVKVGPGEIRNIIAPPPVELGGAMAALQVKETATEVRIALPSDVLFDFDSAKLRAEANAALRQTADQIATRKITRVRIEGHTDAKGSDVYNLKLSKRRADAVRAWLDREMRLRSLAFQVEGYAARRPVAPNAKPDGRDDPEGRQRNRRVEVVLQK